MSIDMKFLVYLFPLIVMYSASSSVQNKTEGKAKVCYGKMCPEKTSYCMKRVSISPDSDHFICNLNCLDSSYTSVYFFNATSRNSHIKNNILEIDFEGFALSRVKKVSIHEMEALHQTFCPEPES